MGVLLALVALPGRAAADGTTAPGPSGSAAPALWQPRGTPLAGAATTADAPAMRPAVTYQDSIKVGESRFYGVTLDDRASAAVSVFAVPPAGTRVSYGDGLELTLQSPDGDQCDSAEAHFGDDGDPRPVGTAVSRLITGDSSDACQDANEYTLEVHRTSAGTSDPGPWPLELRYVAEPGLTEGAPAPSAPATSADGGATGTASPTPLLVGTPHQAAGGPSFETAAAVRTGIWKDRVLPGETRFYKVPVDWGQQATVFADFSNAQVVDASAYVPGGVRLSAYSPVRELIDGEDKSYQGAPASLGEQLAPVAYGNRAADDDDVAAARYAGWYYFAVTVHPGVAQAVSGAVPVTLRVQVTGTAQPPPAYDGDPSAAGIGVDAHDLASADGTADGGSGTDSGALRFLAFAALGAGTVLLLTLAVWFALARRRPAASADTVTAPPQQPGYGPPGGW
ncbi:hypothetical protein V2S66_03485 [Streptomyces sp. V4-01]|uniref:Peptidase n=1 Tax=Actinacidiphila polyblastidii TaxID=3110430 RepID=A0ABU7P5E2_9ACTN|nr:hypothetical protein [Streptomyces sp. V4-01]